MRILLCLLLLALFAGVAPSQHSNGYLFVAPGRLSADGPGTLQMGLGGELVFLRRLGAGFEAGFLGPRENLGDGFAVLSANGYGHFGSGRLDPFVTAGYSRLQRAGGLNAFNYGVGTNYWFRRRLGVRLEFRDHVAQAGETVHFWGVRFGLVF